MTAERAIHASIFVLLLFGLAILSAWAIYTYINVQQNLILIIACTPLSWGIILLVLYVTFKKLGWEWWSQKPSI